MRGHKKYKRCGVIALIGLIIYISLLFSSCAEPKFSEEEWYKSVKETNVSLLYADHYNEEDGVFFNPWMPSPKIDLLSRIFSKKKEFPPFPEEPYQWKQNDYEYIKNSIQDTISFAGHASFIINIGNNTVITDPLFSDRAGIAGKEVKIKFDYTKIPESPIVLISHNHYDHLDKDSIEELIDKKSIFLVPLKLKKYIEGWGAENAYELDWWETIEINNVKYTFVPAQHWSMRAAFGNGNDKTLWGGWIIESSKTIYFSGDTGYFRGFEEIGKRWDIDYALLGVGAYEPRWFMHYNHTSPNDFIMATDDLSAKVSIPMHFGVIALGDEPINYPLYIIDEYIKNNVKYKEKIKLLRVGEYIEIE